MRRFIILLTIYAAQVPFKFCAHEDKTIEHSLCATLKHAEEKFMKDFIATWTKVMNFDRFDLA